MVVPAIKHRGHIRDILCKFIITMNFGKNPVKGGSPARERVRSIKVAAVIGVKDKKEKLGVQVLDCRSQKNENKEAARIE